MFALSLLISAAAGVNAILGGEVRAIQISDDSFICADDCAYGGIYLQQNGHWCPDKEVVRIVDPNGQDVRDSPYTCTGAKLPTGYTERQRSKGGNPWKCDVYNSTPSEPNICGSFKGASGQAPGKIVQWSEIEKELKSATSEGGQGTPDKNKPAPQKSQRECAEDGRQAFLKCRQSRDFAECDEEGKKVIGKCMGRE